MSAFGGYAVPEFRRSLSECLAVTFCEICRGGESYLVCDLTYGLPGGGEQSPGLFQPELAYQFDRRVVGEGFYLPVEL